MFHVSHLTIHPDLHLCVLALRIDVFARCTDKWWVGVNNCGGKVEDRAYRHRVLECGWVERNEGRPSVGKGGGCGEGELEGLLEEEAAKNHEVVAVAVLGLHDSGSAEDGGIHEMGVVGFTQLVIGVIWSKYDVREAGGQVWYAKH